MSLVQLSFVAVVPQTLAGMVESFDTNLIVGVREEPRLTEQQFGTSQIALHASLR